ncbi:hypothetical protein HPDFL43_00420 [Hoeflea phototrophica DFL-43]|jgi:hypothetical protein|uniref:FlgN protein n=1 Tax=Hoeflea phototrophica (strain DSM 17068 / NCIMB 14078 / DFL-43) TaxID=411684 RepID=A9CYQ9_HOEPD|nr:hypothetical protein [Hoeflea phototrophica]EDQ34615.2 hypothetical protein HPDFL43_00420 [Hoeflea phototrophica DFL-43]
MAMTEAHTQDQRIQLVLSRLETVIDAENKALGVERDYDLKRSNALKSRCLYDMTMLFKNIRPGQLAPGHKRRLDSVRAKLDVNQAKVKAHMDAVRDIADMIKESVAESEADGTYSAEQFQGYSLS